MKLVMQLDNRLTNLSFIEDFCNNEENMLNFSYFSEKCERSRVSDVETKSELRPVEGCRRGAKKG